MEQAFVYLWRHQPTLNWYIGSRTAKNCHPDDGYICSSKRTKESIKANPNEWDRSIVAIGEPKEMAALETEILQMFDARKDQRSFNLHNNIQDQHPYWLGIDRPEHSEKLRGRKRLPEHAEAYRFAQIGKFVPEEVRIKQRDARWQGTWVTPFGEFKTTREGSVALNVSKTTIRKWCLGGYHREVWYPPKEGHSFIPNPNLSPLVNLVKLPTEVELAAKCQYLPKKISDSHKETLRNARSKYLFETPAGTFLGGIVAAKENGISKPMLYKRAFGYISDAGTKIDPVEGYKAILVGAH